MCIQCAESLWTATGLNFDIYTTVLQRIQPNNCCVTSFRMGTYDPSQMIYSNFHYDSPRLLHNNNKPQKSKKVKQINFIWTDVLLLWQKATKWMINNFQIE